MQALPKRLKGLTPCFTRVEVFFRSFQHVYHKPFLSVDLARLICCSCACRCGYSFTLHEGGHEYEVELPDGSRICKTCYIVCLWNELDVQPLDPW